MEKYSCFSDIGSVFVGTVSFRVALPNIGGDGITDCCVYEDRTEAAKYIDAHPDVTFVTIINGSFNIYDHDCSRGASTDIIASYSGRYAVYQAYYMVLLVKSN